MLIMIKNVVIMRLQKTNLEFTTIIVSNVDKIRSQ